MLSYSQYVTVKKQAQDTKSELSTLWCTLLSFDMVSIEDLEEEPANHPFEDPAVRISDTGHLCDDIVKYCNEQLKIMDTKKEKNIPVVYHRDSRWV